jgi:antitoxin component YwqK of YwqJK toxin-antitoxin module
LLALIPTLCLAEETKPNLDDPATRNAIVATALNREMMEEHSKQGECLIYVKGSEAPYTGWVKKEADEVVLGLYQYKNGKAHGVQIFWQRGSSADLEKYSENNYKDGIEHGLHRDWHSTGNKYSDVYYKDGKKHGLVTMWHKNGQKSCEAHYKNGNLHGKYTHWGYHGQIEEIIYNNGLPYSATIRTRDGAMCPFTNLKDGNGVLVEYHGRHGYQWYATHYRDGKKHGLETEFDSEGSITRQTRWENGEEVETIKSPSPVIFRKEGESSEEFNERLRETLIEQMRKRGMTLEWKPQKDQ